MPVSSGTSRESQSPGKLRVRINQIDYNLVPPGNLDNSNLPRAPVIRIFGPSSTGQKGCVHVHQVYPYLFIDYPGPLTPRHVHQYASKLSRSLNHAVALSLKRNPSSPKSRFIRAIVLVKGIDFYGFHASYNPFLKILIADPAHVPRISTILQSGSVMSARFRVYESHLSYILQFLCDFGLYGCGIIELEDAFERCADAADEAEESNTTGEVIQARAKFTPSSYFRESRLPLEVDIIAPQILNRHRLAARNIHHKLQIPALPQSSEQLVLSVRELWEDERKHRQESGLHPSPEIRIDLSESTRGKGGDWVAEARWWDEIARRIEHDRHNQHTDDEERTQEWERFVMTTFESVEAIWDKEYRAWKPDNRQKGEGDQTGKAAQMAGYTWEEKGTDFDDDDPLVDVDISMLSEQDISQLDESDESRNQQEHLLGEGAGEGDNESEVEEDNMYANDPEILVPYDVKADEVEERLESDGDPFRDSHEGGLETLEYRLSSPPAIPGHEFLERENSPSPLSKNPSDPQISLVDDTASQPVQAGPDSRPLFLEADDMRILDVGIRGKHNSTSNSPAGEGDLAKPLSAEDRSSLINAHAVIPSRAFNSCQKVNSNRYIYSLRPPTVSALQHQLQALGLPSKIYQVPYYSKDSDIPEITKEYAGLTYRLKGGQDTAWLEAWSTSPLADENILENNCKREKRAELDPLGVGGWEYASHPPGVTEIRRSLDALLHTANTGYMTYWSQIEGPTPANIYGFKTSPTGGIDIARESADLSIMSLELFAVAQDDKIPNPETDEIVAIFYAFHVVGGQILHSGVLVQNRPHVSQKRLRQFETIAFDGELDLLNGLIDLVIELDPDILTGWEIQINSWGFLEARGGTYGISVSELISRAPPRYSYGSASADQWSSRKASTFKVAGRHVLNLWRVVRAERTLNFYTFENVVFDVLRRRVPKYDFKVLTEWYWSPVAAHTTLFFQHLIMRVHTNLELLREIDTVTKTAEFARVFGVDFFSVLTRGSQFKVESFMFRIAKPECFVLISPSRDDVGRQNAAECMPLIMEPESAFYTSPVLILDFQSLYPSVMIAYNYCYSTCLGRVTEFQGSYKFGVIPHLNISPSLLENLHDYITVSPNGIMYAKPSVRKGLLGRMLIELLDTRVMVKQAMQRVGSDKARKRILDARQLSLKYIANVTYGYTSATFSGRMPAVEIADSIVQSGRETLEKAIEVIEKTTKWGARVVYGDTDSVFVSLPGKTTKEAFTIGCEIAAKVTSMNPSPIKLKFEKVYLPCVLLAKKRYVGFKYESVDETEPLFDAKGIETVRRDGVLAQRKMVENCLKKLFRSQDLSEVKDYCCRTWAKILEDRVPVQDFIFAKEVRMGTYSDRGPPPPGAIVAARRMANDPNDEVQYGDRIPYVIARSTTGERLVDRAMDPLEFMNNSQNHLDAAYYITRVLIPPLERVFNLVGADIRQWFNEMPKSIVPEVVSPRKQRIISCESPDRKNINEHFLSTQCLACGEPAGQGLCDACSISPQATVAHLRFRIRKREERLVNTHMVCVRCVGSAPTDAVHCTSLDCPWFYARRKAEAETEVVPALEELLDGLQAKWGGAEDEDDLASESLGTDDTYEVEGSN